MRIVLDSNEYINFLNSKSIDITNLLGNDKIEIYANELIVKEVLRNINEVHKAHFFKILLRSNVILHKEKLSLALFIKYKSLGLKKGDIVIASLCEYVEADYLISENRHFLKNKSLDKFRILTLIEYLKRIYNRGQ